MSADNGIYILETRKGNEKEYRVAHLQAVENVYWHMCSVHKDDYQFGNEIEDAQGIRKTENCHECHTGECRHSKCHIQQARRMWDKSQVYASKDKAFTKANVMYDDIMDEDFCPIVEYGISSIPIDEEF